MVEITDEMLSVVNDYNSKARTMTDTELAKRIIELHEANKPKPEPVGYIYPSGYKKALNEESCCLMFVVPVTNMNTGEESTIALYTTPPTRKPLSDNEIAGILKHCKKGASMFVNFARAIEQAHGITF